MVGTCEEKYVYLEDLKPWVEIPSSWVQSQGPLLAIRPPAGISVAELAEKMNEGLSSGKIENRDKLRVYLKEDLPERSPSSSSDPSTNLWPKAGGGGGLGLELGKDDPFDAANIWETAANQGFPAAVYFWAGGEVRKGSWKCRGDSFCPKYNKSVPFEERVDAVLSYFDLPREEVPVFTALYFSDPDAQGHVFGPDHPEITRAVVHLDRVLGRLIEGLEERGIFEEVSIILVGDHGMVGTCEEKYVYLEDLKPWVEIPSSWVQSQGPLLAIRPPAGISVAELAEKMNEGLSSGKIENRDKLRVYLKEDLPERSPSSSSDPSYGS
ncbi:venom phosphodiesterase 2-like [Asparagus officinalis]|uniref:venom phosphodiesterase 2-like n=1 Tax=Asparagus officinalis TaxID=4686 RepID=UPI00098E1BA1|nr:venom phosphodiesterase 2-like [Asparagus officinalis]